ncbi:hypothetical protein BGZ95_005470 [Linnemannia exigua]|uniref:Uncharacterized protein n=1 Tax=Linnemannia exigua TaxID=604196 RepID=A0AAD4H913_9FUNG|nr:hypothetical protein BGZ95_005470 [Linnemannia exigua]
MFANSTQLPTQLEALEEFALNPDKRFEIVQKHRKPSREYYLYGLQKLSQDLQDPTIPPTKEKVDQAVAFLEEAEDSGFNFGSTVFKQVRVQLAILGFHVDPELLTRELSFNPNSVTQLESVVAKDNTTTETSQLPQDIVDTLATTIDQRSFKTDVLTKKVIDDIALKGTWKPIPEVAWPHLLSHPDIEEALLEKLNIDRLLAFFKEMNITYSPKSLHIIGRADTSRMDELVVKIIQRLYDSKRLNFSEDIKVYKNLTSAQLDVIKQENPGVMANEGFVGLLEKRLLPLLLEDAAKVVKGEVHQEWLDRMIAFVDTLPSKFNRHTLSVYLMSLEFDLARGIKNKAKFMRYISIYRNHYEYNSTALKNQEYVDMNNNRALPHWSKRVKVVSRDRDSEIVNEYLMHFLKIEKSITEYEPYFSTTYLELFLARTMLCSGDTDEKWSKLLNDRDNIVSLTDRTVLQFSKENPDTFLPSDPVVFKLKVKNANRILVRIFEVKTLEYLQQHDGPVGQKLNLDGLTPNWERSMTFEHPAIELHDVLIDLPELADRRGSFIVDIISSGENSSCYFTKGCFDYVQRPSVAGHVLTIVDEDQKKIDKDVSIWFNGYYYKTNEKGDIVIPFRRKDSSTPDSHIYIIHKDFATRRAFHQHPESYSMSLSYHLDSESLVAGSFAKVLLKPFVELNNVGVTCPAGLLEQVSLEVVTGDTSGIEVTNTISDFKVYDADWSEHRFQVPENFSTLELTLSARIKVLATGEYQELFAEKSIHVDTLEVDRSVTVVSNLRNQSVQVHGEVYTPLKKTSSGYEVHVFGKNGEKRPNIPLQFTLTHAVWTESFTIYLRSDENGVAHLGPLQDIQDLTCELTRNVWELHGQIASGLPELIHGSVGQPIHLPMGRSDVTLVRTISLFRRSPESGADECLLEDCTSKAKYDNGVLTIKNLIAGYYTLKMGTQDGETREIEVTICHAPTKPIIEGLEEFNIDSKWKVHIPDSAKHPLFVQQPVANEETQTVEIQVRNWTPDTRVSVIATKFLPAKMAFENLSVGEFEKPALAAKAELTSTSYRTGRILGDEYQYILNRKAQSTHWAGNLLTKPSVLLVPYSIADTTMKSQSMANQNTANMTATSNAFGSPAGARRGLDRGGAARHRRVLGPGLLPALGFMANPNVVIVNLIPDQVTGLVSLPYSAFGEGSFLQIFVSDAHQSLFTTLVVPGLSGVEYQKRDLCFKSALKHNRHYIGERTGVQLDPKLLHISTAIATTGGTSPNLSSSSEAPSIQLSSTGSSASSIRVINSVSQVYDLLMTLLQTNAQTTLRKFGFVVDWDRLSLADKDEKFSKWTCHELNLFLYKKDRKYFDDVVAPFIKNKLIKSFIDDYLIGTSLEKYTTLKEFNLLTCMEKCLLAQRIPRLKPSVAQWIRSRARNTKVAADIKLFQTVMKSGAVQELAPAPPAVAATYRPTSPQYAPTSPKYSPSSPSYSPTSPSLQDAMASALQMRKTAIRSESVSEESDNDSDDFEFVERSAPPPPPPSGAAYMNHGRLGSAVPPPPPPPSGAAYMNHGGFGSAAPPPPPPQLQYQQSSFAQQPSAAATRSAPLHRSAPSAAMPSAIAVSMAAPGSPPTPGSFGFLSPAPAPIGASFSFGLTSSVAPSSSSSSGGGGGSLFGAAPPSGRSAFGAPAGESTFGAPAGGSVFGGGNSLFSGAAATFGATGTSGALATVPSTIPAFGSTSTPSSSGLFGSTFTPSSGNLFGEASTPSTSSVFGVPPSGSALGSGNAATPSTFGLPTNAPPPGSFGSFGASTTTTTTSIFEPSSSPQGSAPKSSVFGTNTGPSLLESMPPLSSLFANATLPAAATNLFGGKSAPASDSSQSAFGAPRQSPAAPPGGLIGIPAIGGGFGSAANNSSNNLFGGFRATSLTSSTLVNPFGSPAASSTGDPRLDSILNNSDPPLEFGLDSFKSGRTTSSSSGYLNSVEAREKTSQTVQSQFKPVDLTKEMAETYYWARQDVAKMGAGDVNAFWLDFAEWDESLGGSFLSQNFVVNTETFTNAMATLALLDVTFRPKETSVRRTQDRNLAISSKSPAIIFHSSTKETQEPPATGSVLVTQQYFSQLDRTEYDAKLMTNVRSYIQPGAEFRPLESYGAHVVLMNATPNPMRLHVEVQLPEGAMPIYGNIEAGQDIMLTAHGNFQYEYKFYFPKVGDYPHYPAHVSDYDDIIAFAQPSVLKVRTRQPGSAIRDTLDKTTWSYVLTHGSQEDVLTKLAQDPLDGMRVEILIPRLYRDSAFLRRVTDVMRDRHEYNDRIWSVSLVLKGEDKLVSEYIAQQAIYHRVGDWFTSPLLKRRTQSRYEVSSGCFHYLEYFPLINARVHKAKRDATILNDRFRTQYDRFLNLLCQKPQHDSGDLLVLIVYLLAQDRIMEAKEHFVTLSKLFEQEQNKPKDEEQKREFNTQQIQYDYLRAYLSLCVEVQVNATTADLELDLEGVQEIVKKYKNYPVKRWNRLFKDMRIYVDAIQKSTVDFSEDAAGDLIAVVDTAAATSSGQDALDDDGDSESATVKRIKEVPVTVDFKIGADSQIEILHSGVDEVTVEYYVIDAEIMFSSSPLTFSENSEVETQTASNSVSASGSSNNNSAFSPQVLATNSYRLLKPNGTDKHTVQRTASQETPLKVAILEKYRNTNVMVSVSSSPPSATRTWKAYHSQTISVQCHERSGTIKIMTKFSDAKQQQQQHVRNRAIRGAYVKVYAEMKFGFQNTVFWKDGYTDLIGQFAYAAVSTGATAPGSSSSYGYSSGGGRSNGLSNVKRFVVFVDGGQEGCVVKTVPVPPV